MTPPRGIDFWRDAGSDGRPRELIAEIDRWSDDPATSPLEQADLAVARGLLLGIAGEVVAGEEAIRRGEQLFATLPDDDTTQFARTVLSLAVGGFAVLFGRLDEGDAHFADAIERAGRSGHRGLLGAARMIRAEHTWFFDPRRAHDDARASSDLLAEAGVELDRRRSRRLLATISLAAGEPEAAIVQADETLRAAGASPIERARAKIVRGKALGFLDRSAEGIVLVREGTDELRGLDVALWELEGLRALLDLDPDPDRSRAVVERARELLRPAPPVVVDNLLWARLPALEIRLLGDQAISIEGVPVEPSTGKPAELLFVLVVAGDAGLTVEAIADALWPGKDHERQASSVSTALWEARRLLGPAAWRLRRTGDHVRLELEGARVDLVTAEETARAAATGAIGPDDPRAARARALLDEQLLPAWPYEDWHATGERRVAAARRILTGL